MVRLRNSLAAAVLAGAGIVATPGTAFALSCQPSLGPSGGTTLLTGTLDFVGRVSCDGTVASLSVTAYLYRVVPVAGNTLVGTATNTTVNSSYVEATASTPCLPGLYTGAIDVTIVWPGGSSFSGHYDYSQTIVAICA